MSPDSEDCLDEVLRAREARNDALDGTLIVTMGTKLSENLNG